MGRSLLLALALVAADVAPPVAAPQEDPLVGTWLNPHGDDGVGTGALCDFFPNRAWNGDCLNLYGYGAPTTWERLGAGRYFFGTSGHKCWVQATFDDDRVELSLRCGSWRPKWNGWSQPPAPLMQSVSLVRYRYP